MRSAAEPTSLLRAVAVAFLALTASGAGGGESGGPSAAGAPDPATVGLVRDQAIVGRLLEPHVSVETRYGLLKVPAAEIIRVRFHPTLAGPEEAILRATLEVLEREGPGSAAGKRALEDLRALGAPVYLELKNRLAAVESEEVRTGLEGLLLELEQQDGAYLDERDEVVTERFTIRGRVVEETFRFECLSGTLAIPRADILHITFRDLALRKTWKVGPEHAEREGYLNTEFRLRRGQRFRLTPAGTMAYQGQSYGPGGLQNHTWNGRQMGCLQWRIGDSGPWKVLAGVFEGKADAAGPLQFSVHLIGGPASGEFKVVLDMQVRP